MYRVLKTSQRAVGSPGNKPKLSNLPVTACTQRPHSLLLKLKINYDPALYSVDAAIRQRVHGDLEDPTALPQRFHIALSKTLYIRYNL